MNYTEDPSVLSSEIATSIPTQRPKRADAARNYDKLLAAALEAFTSQGEDASLEGIARRADVDLTLVKPVDAGILRRAAKPLLEAAAAEYLDDADDEDEDDSDDSATN